MTSEKALDMLGMIEFHDTVADLHTWYKGIDDDMNEAVRMGIKALKAEPCEDCISREAAICLADELKDDLPDDDHLSDMVMSHNEGILEYQTKLSLLPSVQPKQRTGRWMPTKEVSVPDIRVCSNCNYHSISMHNYCPSCGAKMIEPQESEGV